MSQVDKQALRKAAQNATDGPWVEKHGEVTTVDYEIDGVTHLDHICNCEIIGTGSPNAEFIAEANPSTVLALLDELVAENGRTKELESQRALAFMACNRWRDKFMEADDKLDAAERRIAELVRANSAQDDHINQQQDRIDQLEKGSHEAAKQISSWRRIAKQNMEELAKLKELLQAEELLPEIECDICGFKSTDPDGAHHCCEDNSND
ncbi:ead/Ea22-like family protein [Edwardsiella tarda]|uniref:ead/Ea22-like family protein n=1 Tax=Edwardsiella tarda TaxID=636 RepID=UPI000D5065AC|nr:ead/Ea22-like family protein [Edwardsiella tarda]UCQ12213.1 ead/Ea22-like family protein [Edwardsiella tarda]